MAKALVQRLRLLQTATELGESIGQLAPLVTVIGHPSASDAW